MTPHVGNSLARYSKTTRLKPQTKSDIDTRWTLLSGYTKQKACVLSIADFCRAFLVLHMSLFNFRCTNSSRSWLVSSSLSRVRRQVLMHLIERDSDIPLSSQTILGCSALAKMTASVATYPHEVVRTRLQTQRRPLADDMSSDGMIKQHPRGGIIYTTQKLIRKEGWTGLYKGLSINLLRTVPNSAVTMLT